MRQSTWLSFTEEERDALSVHDHVALFQLGAHPFLTLTLWIAMFERDYPEPLGMQRDFARPAGPLQPALPRHHHLMTLGPAASIPHEDHALRPPDRDARWLFPGQRGALRYWSVFRERSVFPLSFMRFPLPFMR